MSLLIDHDYCQANIFSEYVKSLSDVDQQRYREKLKVKCRNGGIIIFDDPYLLDTTKWLDNLSLWPDIQYGNIYNYLVESPGDYTVECLKHYRSLDAYNYVLSGKVQKVLIHKHQSLENYRILTAEVQPSQRTSSGNYKPWVLVHVDGVVEAAHCNCVAGLGEACSHIAALLFKIERAVTFGYTKGAPTDEVCHWNNTFKKKVSPSKVTTLDFSKPKWDKENNKMEKKRDLAGEEMSAEELNILRNIQPNAVFFSLIDSDSHEAAEENSVAIPETLPELIMKMEQDNVNAEMFLCSFFNEENCSILESMTRGQINNHLWISQRLGRITSSRFGEVVKRKTWPKGFIETFVKTKLINTEAVKWGQQNEKKAFEAYTEYIKQHHTDFNISDCGLFVNKEAPYLAASPDGIVSCSCCGEGLLEIKCPFKYRNLSPQDAAKNRDFYLDETLKLKRNHNYFFQVHGQMLITKRKYCDFAVWTPVGLAICRIQKNEEIEKQIFEKVKDFFFKCLLNFLKNK